MQFAWRETCGIYFDIWRRERANLFAARFVASVSERMMATTFPPETFQQAMQVPEAAYRSAIAITHNGKMRDVSVTFVLQSRDDHEAHYVAPCPRCRDGSITVAVPLKPDGSFAEPPACPMLCLACEDRMDAMLEPGTHTETEREPSDRAALNQFIRAMNIRSWD